MTNESAALEGILSELLDTQKRLLDLSYEKRGIIVGGDTEGLASLTGAEQRLVAKLRAATRRLNALLNTLSASLGLPAEGLTLGAIAERLEPSASLPLKRLQRELRVLMAAQTDINRINHNLLETHIEYTENMIEVIVGQEDPLNNLYGGDGRANDERRKTTGYFDTQA